jgi:aspartate/methionine/tyrosine aminotransferase
MVTRMHRVRDLVDVIGSVPSERLSAFAFSQMATLKARTKALLTANLDLARKFVAGHPQLLVAEKPRTNVMFPRLAGVADTSAFVEAAAHQQQVAVAAGHYFDSPQHFRISLAGRTDRLAEGLDRLSQALNSY